MLLPKAVLGTALCLAGGDAYDVPFGPLLADSQAACESSGYTWRADATTEGGYCVFDSGTGYFEAIAIDTGEQSACESVGTYLEQYTEVISAIDGSETPHSRPQCLINLVNKELSEESYMDCLAMSGDTGTWLGVQSCVCADAEGNAQGCGAGAVSMIACSTGDFDTGQPCITSLVSPSPPPVPRPAGDDDGNNDDYTVTVHAPKLGSVIGLLFVVALVGGGWWLWKRQQKATVPANVHVVNFATGAPGMAEATTEEASQPAQGNIEAPLIANAA